jgi:hypothetical protein
VDQRLQELLQQGAAQKTQTQQQPKPLELDFLEKYDRPSLLKELLRIARRLKKTTLTGADIDHHGRVSSTCVIAKFGSVNNALMAAGLRPSKRLSNEDLLRLLLALWERTREDSCRGPRASDCIEYGLPVKPSTFSNRFGSWKKARLAAFHYSVYKEIPPDKLRTARRAEISNRTRFHVFQRDLYACRICKTSGVKLELDHIVPMSQGGSNDFDNLQTLCVPCNRGKSDSRQ